jgi:hypothetical protein
MGPALILDKSAFQALGRDEHIERHFMFMENVTPVLLREIAGNLAKNDGSRDPVALVQTLAKKFGGSGGKINVAWEVMCFNSLLGESPPMTGQLMLDLSVIDRVTVDADGVGVFMSPSPENYAIMRWAEGKFSEDERNIAQEFRASVRALTSKAIRGRLGSLTLPDVRDIGDIPARVADFLGDSQNSLIVIHWLLDQLRPL